MTLNELKSDVASLGFESYVEDEDCFIASVNRALNIIYTDRPVSKTMKIGFSSPKISFLKEFTEHHSGDVISFAIDGRGVSFRTTGEGECVINDSGGGSLLFFSGKDQLTKKRLQSAGTITFSGDYYFTISNLAVFSDMKNSGVTDIPEYLPMREISPSEYCDDFRAFAELPRDSSGKIISEAKMRDGRISLPYGFNGDIYLTYYRLPKKVTADDGNVKVDVSEECAGLLPLLTASFTWLDDDAQKAQYYMSLYRDSIANIKRFSTIQLDTGYRVNGWA